MFNPEVLETDDQRQSLTDYIESATGRSVKLRPVTILIGGV